MNMKFDKMFACTPDMAYEALASLQQTLKQILQRDHDNLTTRRVKREIISIHDQAVVLQLNLNDFPEKETIREVASTTHEIIEYLFSPKNLSDCGSREPSVRLSNQLRELAEEVESTTGDVVDYCKSNNSVYNVRQLSESPVVSSTSRSALTIKDEDPAVSIEPTVRLTNRLGKLAEKILSTARDDLVSNVRLSDYLAVSSSGPSPKLKGSMAGIAEDLSYSPVFSSSSTPAPKLEGSMAGFAEDLSYFPVFSSSSRPAPTGIDDVVGFEEDLMMIKDRLCGQPYGLQVLPVVGMGGSGKTMLVNAVYNDALIIDHFDIRGWVKISQDYSVGNVLYNLLASLKTKMNLNGTDTLEEIQAKRDVRSESDYYRLKIFQHLFGRRYLIVMDDIWSTNVWNDVRSLFPDNKNGSWVIFTTRLLDVAASANSSSTSHMMHLLDEQQSWYLFERKVFADQTCPDELQSVGRKIVKSCGGLPLAIIRVAGLLSRIARNPKFWEQVVAADGQLESILSLSYIHLPHHLKACFLYMAAFPEDYEIRVSELIKLWVAEGFLEERPNGSTSLEETAQYLLEDLVDRSLVLATSWKMIDGKIKSCRLHNMVRDFCARQAGQERLLLPVMDYLPSPILRRHFLPQVLQNHQRLSVSWCDLDLKDSTHSSCTKSIICIPQKGYRPRGSVRNFSLLRVLHVLRRNDHSYWELGQVFDLIYLTYLASNIPSSIVPPAISKLQNLQTLIIYRSGVSLPVEIWRMRQLRHLIAFSFDPLPHPDAADVPLENLQTLSLPTNMVCSERMMKMIPNIQKLGIYYSGEKFDEGYHFHNLKHLLRLEKLKLEMRSSFRPLNPVFPWSLKKLTLTGCRLPWEDMKIVGWLPNLQGLKLRNYACDGKHWETAEGEFPSLSILLIDESNLRHWTTESSHFPRLKHLMVHRCPHLTEIPWDIGEIPTLELIEVDDRNQSLLNSAKMILEEQVESYGNDILQVRVKRF